MVPKRVVITGMGAVSCIGNSVPEMWSNLVAGKSGIAPLTAFDASNFSCRIAGEVKLPDMPFLSLKEKRRMARFHLLATAAAEEAVRQAGLAPDQTGRDGLDSFRFGVIVGNGGGGLEVYERNLLALHARGCGAVSALYMPLYIVNIVSGLLAIRYQANGVNFTPATACATGTHAIGEAYKSILCGQADVVLTGGSEACITPGVVAGFQALTALSCRNDEPEKANRPFDRDRDGFVLSEGAGILVLEELEHAKRRGANILAEISGYGATADAYHITSPLPDGSADARAMTNAMQQAEITPEQIGYLCAHGTGTAVNDLYESRAVRIAFGEYADKLPVNSIKSMIGHALGAVGALESIACIMAIRENIIPPTVNCDNPDPECRLNIVRQTALKKEFDYALNNSLGFGGQNAALIFNRYKEN